MCSSIVYTPLRSSGANGVCAQNTAITAGTSHSHLLYSSSLDAVCALRCARRLLCTDLDFERL